MTIFPMADQLVLYLDFDGVLHPHEVYLVNGQPELQGEHAHLGLFCWAPILEEILAPYPDVKIKLSTSWVHTFGFDFAKDRLPKSLQERVIGATQRSQVLSFRPIYRLGEIYADVLRNDIQQWLAIDNDTIGWAEEFRKNLVATDDFCGLGHPDAQRDLKEKLAIGIAP